MIISRAPLRVSFAGGGSDLPAFYRKFGGAVISTAIDKYIFVTINRKFDNGVRVAYSRTEEVCSSHQVKHPLVRAALNLLEIDGGVEITTVADIPSRGTGLGSSSTFTVALLHALHAYQGRHVPCLTLAEQACHVEIDICGQPIGKQDQFAAAFGGFRVYEFHPDDTVSILPVICKPSTIDRLNERVLLLYTGITRSSSALLKEQSARLASDSQQQSSLKRMVSLCYQLRDEIQNDNLDSVGEILHEAWMLKRGQNDRISNSAIDEWYEIARRYGAIGGKILGAGSGGFLMLYAAPESHAAIRHALPELRAMPTGLERSGSQIIFYQPRT